MVWPGNEEYLTMDSFRFDDNGQIVEHYNTRHFMVLGAAE